jgi:hypothetical protein
MTVRFERRVEPVETRSREGFPTGAARLRTKLLEANK